MGSIVFDFLTESILFDERHIENAFASVQEPNLQKELERYREFIKNNLQAIQEEVTQSPSALRIFGAKDFLSVDNIMQTAWYMEQVIIPDPIFPITAPTSEFSRTASKAIGLHGNSGINRIELASAARKMKTLAPMVAANYVRFFPASYYSETPTEIPIQYSEYAYADTLPSEILDVYHQNALVRSLKKTDDGLLLVEPTLQIGRGIAVSFKNDNADQIQFYHLHEPKIIEINEDTGIAKFVLTLPDEPPSVEQFRHWLYQSVNQTARAHYEDLARGLTMAAKTGASYITNSEFTQVLLDTPSSKEDIEQYSVECVLNLELPFLTNVNMADLMRVRQEDGDAFELFRKKLESTFRELRLENDPEKIKLKVQNAIHELGEVQYTQIDQRIKALRKGALAQAGVAVAGLAGSVAISGISILATIAAILAGFKNYSDYKKEIKENPAYFLWKVKK